MSESAQVCNLVEVVGEYASSCGYCHSGRDSSVAYGMTAERLTVQAYQDLLDRGWRRSGTWLYLPSFDKTCCPCYTHRLEASKFVPDKGQRRVQRKFDAFLEGSEPAGTSKETVTSAPQGATAVPTQQPDIAPADPKATLILGALQAAVQACVADGVLLPSLELSALKVLPPSSQAAKATGALYTSPAALALAAAARKFGVGSSTLSGQEVAAKLAKRMSDDRSFGWRVEAVAGHLNFSPACNAATRCQASEVPSLPQMSKPETEQNAASRASSSQEASSSGRGVRAAEGYGDQSQQKRGRKRSAGGVAKGPKRRLEIVMVASSEALVALEFPLYRKYQIQHHKDPPTKVTAKSFRRFLIDSPLVPLLPSENPAGGCPPCGFGSFHQQYWLDGVLIAVGVVDVLPRCMSSKYFFWDPDLAALSLGKVSAMQEISWVAAAAKTCPTLEYLYLGYFIADCPKMRYKVDFRPAELLCPRRLAWIPYQQVEPAFRQSTRVALSEVLKPLPGKQLEDGTQYSQPAHDAIQVPGTALKTTKVVFSGEKYAISVQHLIQQQVLPEAFLNHFMIKVEEWRRLVGPVADSMALVLG